MRVPARDRGGDLSIPAPDSVAEEKPQGRVRFRIAPLPEPDPRDATAEGKSVRGITITGNKVTKYYVILRELELASGRPFAVATMKADVARLDNLGIFSSVTITPREVFGDRVDVEVAVREMPWIVPYASLSVTDQGGLSVGPALASLNLLGRDIGLSGRALFGGSSTYQVTTEWPWITGNHVSFEFFGGHIIRNDDLRGFRETSDEVTPWIGTYLGKRGRLRGGFSYFHMKSNRDDITLNSDNRDTLLRLGAAIGVDTRDSWTNPHRGWENQLQAWRTGGFLGGDADFWTNDVDIRRYQPVGRNTLVLSGLSTVQTGALGIGVPVYMDYRMGGANSIRGYRTSKLGKTLAGKNQLITTFEYQYLLWDVREITLYGFAVTFGLEIAAFLDTGIAWNTAAEFNSDRAKTGFGVGLRPLVPGVGEVRLDLGLNTSGDVVFHLATSPKMAAQRLRLR